MKRNRKLFGMTRRFWSICIAVVIVLGMIYIPELKINAAVSEPALTDYYRIQWPVDDPKASCNVHFVDKNGNVLPTGEKYIDVEKNKNSRSNNVKSIWGEGNENVKELPDSNDADTNSDGYYTNLLDLISADPQNKFYNENLKDYEFVRAYVWNATDNDADADGKFDIDEADIILPYLYGINGDETNDVINMRYYREFCPDTGNLKDYGELAAGKDIYLVYKERTAPSVVQDTISNAEIGLDIYMFNYPNKQDGENIPDSDGTWGTDGYKLVGHQTGLYSNVLEDGFPVYNNDGVTVDMEDYFNPEKSQYYVGTADYLFQQYPNGIYYYNSAWNAAYYNEGTDKFVLYDEVVTTLDSQIVSWQAYKRGNFLPFNDIDKSKIWAFNIDNDDELQQRGTPVYGLKDTEVADYHFGMYITGNIYQTKDGKVKDAAGKDTDMIFHITGDDDILVYIDDVLVLDLGGIHEPLAGTINFATGVVEVDGGAGNKESTTLKALLEEKAKDSNGNSIQFKGDTLADNSLHSIKVFYAERGNGASNLWVELNAPEKPSITIENSFWLDENGDYSTPFNGMNNNIKDAQYILKEVTVDATGKVTGIVNENVKTISYKDFDENGTYEFKDLDYHKHYVVEQKLYDAQGNVVDGSTGEHSYEFTLLNVDGTDANDKMEKNAETPAVSFSDGTNIVLNSTIEFKNVYNAVGKNTNNTEKKGSIVIDNSFILSKLDGTTISMDNAPKEEDFTDVVFSVKDDEGNTAATVKYDQLVNGKYTVGNLDLDKKYTVEITGISSDDGNGGTEAQPYVNTTIDGTERYTITNVEPTENGTPVKVVNTYRETKKGSIVIDNSFILSKLDGTKEPMNSAPNKEEFENVVFLVKDEAGNVVATVKYNQFLNGKYIVTNLDEGKIYTIEITGISMNSGNGGTEEHAYLNTTIDGTKSYIIGNVVASANGTNVQVVNVYDEYAENESIPNVEKTTTGDDQPIFLMTVLLLIAFCGVAVCVSPKRKKVN